MYIKDEPALIHVHIPKNAGKSVHAALLEKYGATSIKIKKKHTSLNSARCCHMDEEDWWRAFKFTVVRNPWDRAVSQWTYSLMTLRQLRGHRLIRDMIPVNEHQPFWKVKQDRQAMVDLMLRESFGWWMMDFNQRPGVRWFHYRLKNKKHNLINVPQSMWLTTDGKLVTDKIYRFEDLGELERDLGLSLDVINPSPREGHYRDYYNTKTRKWVAKVYAEDIDRFAYTF